MKKKEGKKSPYFWGLPALAAFALFLQLGAVGALAQDTDKDGFAETTAITLPTGMSLAAYPNDRSLPLCATGIPRDKCIDPATKDLFVIIQRGATSCPAVSICNKPCSPTYGRSDIPMPPYDPNNNLDPRLDPLALVRTGGLGVTTHELIQASGYTSQAIADYFAVKVIENLNPCSSWMGFSTFGTFDAPYAGGIATVWPEYIKNWIAEKCSVACFDEDKNPNTPDVCYTPNTSAGFYCKNINTNTTVNMKNPDPVLVKKLNGEFIQNIVNHEVSHLIHLASANGTVDHHYPIAQGVLMEQFIGTKVTKDAKGIINVILYISKTYTRDDKGQFWLEKP